MVVSFLSSSSGRGDETRRVVEHCVYQVDRRFAALNEAQRPHHQAAAGAL
jgi:hypothetical protein